jgi:hypothetical protein
MAKYYILILKIINILIFIWLLTVFSSIFHFEAVLTTESGELVFTAFITSLRTIFSLLIFSAAYIVAIGVALITSIILIGYGLHTVMFRLIEQFFRGLISLWFVFPSGSPPQLNQILDLIGIEFGVFSENIYLFAFQILYIISILYMIRAFFRTNPKNDMIAIGALVLMIVIPLMVFGFRDLLALFHVSIPLLENLPNPLDISLNEIPIDDIFQFFGSSVILLAILSYIDLEISFQINYAYTVTKPTLERKDRLEAQLNILQSQSHFVIANVDKIKEEAKKRREELKIEEKATISKFFAKTGETFSYVKEMIERHKLEEEEKKLVAAASKTRRLGGYIQRLFQEDSEAKDTLTARSSAPKSRSLILSTLFNFVFRVGLLIVISFIIIHPRWILEEVFHLPPAITESVAIFSPEVIVILLIPLILLFPVISKIISTIKYRNLIIKLQQEGRIKEILASVGDYVKKDQETSEDIKIEESANSIP